MIKKTNASEQSKNLMPISEEELDSAYGCSCDNCRSDAIYKSRCCFKDCYSISTRRWTSFLTTVK